MPRNISLPVGAESFAGSLVSFMVLMVILLTTFSIPSSAQGDVSNARIIVSPILVDGNDKDWTQPLNFYDDKTGLLFAIGNDNRNLYLCFTGKDDLKMKKLLNAGWSVGISSKENKHKYKSVLLFPRIKGMAGQRGAGKFEGNPISKKSEKIDELEMTLVKAKGFKSNISEISLNDKKGIDIGIGVDSLRQVVFEMAIPLTELFVEEAGQVNQLFTLEVAVNAMDRPSSSGGGVGERSRMGGRSGGGRSGSMGGGRRGGGMEGEGAGGGRYQGSESGDRGSFFERESFKQKFRLSVPSK